MMSSVEGDKKNIDGENFLCDNSSLPIEPRETTWKWCLGNLWWNRPPPEILQNVEEAIIQRCATPSRGWYVDIRSELMFDESDKKCCQRKQNEVCRIWTRKFEKVKIVDNKTLQNGHAHGADNDKKNDCLVMVHGLGAGGALFALNFDGLSKHFTVYCLDLPGFARSSRFKFSTDPTRCETQFLSILEAWRENVGLNRMNLLGHSFGGYICAAYAVKYPERINHLILADPWGLTALPPEIESGQFVSPSGRVIPWWFVFLFKIYSFFNPLALFRFGGRYTLGLIKRRRKDICEPFNLLWEREEDNVAGDYLHQANLHTPTGESAFCTLAKYFFWSKLPFINRINELDASIPLTAIYGDHSWMPSVTREEYEHARNGEGYCRVKTVEDAGHHVYSKFEEFNKYVIKACQVSNPTTTPKNVQ